MPDLFLFRDLAAATSAVSPTAAIALGVTAATWMLALLWIVVHALRKEKR